MDLTMSTRMAICSLLAYSPDLVIHWPGLKLGNVGNVGNAGNGLSSQATVSAVSVVSDVSAFQTYTPLQV